MPAPTLKDPTRLSQWDTPTIYYGLAIVCSEQRVYGLTTEPLVSLAPEMPR